MKLGYYKIQEQRVYGRTKKENTHVKFGMAIFFAGEGILLWYYLLYNTLEVKRFFRDINGILTPFYLGIIMAYLLCPIYNNVLRIVYNWNRGRFRTYLRDYRFARVVATVVSFIVLIVVLVGFFMLIIPELLNSMVGLVSDIPVYVENAIEWIEKTVVEN